MENAAVIHGGAARRGAVTLRAEWGILLALLALFFAVNLATASRSPLVWTDEAMYSDAAMNAANGQGFQSTTWPYQHEGQFWGGDAPLHTMLLVPWLKVFGANMIAVRAINYFFVALAVTLAWIAVRRGGVIKTPWLRLTMVVLLLCENSIAFSYRGGRFDMLGMVWTCMAIAAMTIRDPKKRLAALFVSTLMMPISGLQLIPMAAVEALIVLAMWRKKVWREVAALLAGLTVGAIAMFALLHALGTWDALMQWMNNSTAGQGGPAQPTGKLLELWRVIGGLTYLSHDTFAVHDFSLLPTVLVAVAVLLIGGGSFKRPEWACLAMVALVPVALVLTSQFPPYYVWMIALPATVAAVSSIDRIWGVLAAYIRTAIATGLLVACALGLPARLAVTVYEWQSRDPSGMEAFTRKNLRKDDVVFADHTPFYPLHAAKAKVYFYYVGQLTPEEKKAVTVIMAADSELAQTYQKAIGGTWKLDEEYGTGTSSYHLVVYRRES